MRLLAKIAWGFTVARYLELGRLDELRSSGVLDVIHGTDDDASTWVGCPSPDVAGSTALQARA